MKTVPKLLLTLTVTLLFCGLFAVTRQVSAAEIVKSGSCGDNVTYTLYNDGELVISGTGAMWEVGSFAATPWYDIRASIKKISIESGVTSIRAEAFYDCGELISVAIPNSVTSIGIDAFECCGSLSDVYITDLKAWLNISFKNYHSNPFAANYDPHKLFINGEVAEGTVYVPEGVTRIPNYAFSNCRNITSIDLPDSVISIGYYAFYGCSGLLSFTIPKSVSDIGDSVFSGCSELKSITIPEGVTSIGRSAFYGCGQLTSIIIPSSVTHITSYAFSNCDNLKGVYITDLKAWCEISFGNDRSNPLHNGADLYVNNALAKNITIPHGVTSIGNYSFDGCRSLTSVNIPDSVTSIGNEAFDGCTGLISVSIPENVTTIKEYAFNNCTSLINIVIPGSVKIIGESDNDLSRSGYAFSGCSSLTSVVMQEGVTSINDNAFNQCSGLISVTIPKSVTHIGRSAFSQCSSLTNLYIADLTAWLNVSFAGYDSHPFDANNNPHKLFINGELVEGTVRVPEGVTQIPKYAFSNCRNITNVILSDSVTSIGKNAFYGCDGLTSVNIPNSVTSIGTYAFYGCDGLTDIVIPDSVTSIGERTFSYCDELKRVVISGNITSLGESVFYRCPKLESVVFKDGFTNIGKDMFNYCSKLERVEIPESVTAILSGAFYNTAITDVYYRGTKSQWNAIAIASNNDVLDRATIHYETAMPEEPEPTPVLPYKVTALKVIGAGGSALAAPPENGGFIAEVSITEVKQRASNDYFVLAAFDRNGRILGVNYARADIPTGGQISFGMTFPDYGEPIKKIKAFVWDTLGDMTPLSDYVEL